jgi:hypothetical protein
METKDRPGLFAWTLCVYFLLLGVALTTFESGAVLLESHLVLRWDIFVGGDPSAGVRLLNFVVLACIINLMLNIELSCDVDTQFDSTDSLAQLLVQVCGSGIGNYGHLCVDDAV